VKGLLHLGPSIGAFSIMSMDTKQAKRLKVDDNIRRYTLRRIAKAATSLSTNLAKRNKLLVQQIECTVDQNALNLFKEARSINPTLADRYFRLRMQEEVSRVEERIALRNTQRQRTQQLATTFSPLHPPMINLEEPT